METRTVAVTGVGLISALGRGAAANWEAVAAGRSRGDRGRRSGASRLDSLGGSGGGCRPARRGWTQSCWGRPSS